MSGFVVDLESLRVNSNLLAEVAGLLYRGCLRREVGTLARRPYVTAEVSEASDEFTRFADEQYRDLVVLVMALATKLKETGQDYLGVDGSVQGKLDRILTDGSYVAPKDR
ncbi:hypothetical protein AB0K14_14045 [Actinosynnema sp. NPDC050801]|uniref:hypothetical protein n=1 Tax=unclassified Actinosynnema TaxID=2637065 RepID=UPI0033D69FCF